MEPVFVPEPLEQSRSARRWDATDAGGVFGKVDGSWRVFWGVPVLKRHVTGLIIDPTAPRPPLLVCLHPLLL